MSADRDPSRCLRIGLAGPGRMGRRHARNLLARVHGASLVAACSPSAEDRQWASAQPGIEATYATYAEMLRHPGLDAVFVVTPVTVHAEQIVEALHAGVHVFCEKPLALDVGACLRVEAEAARHPDQVVMIGFVRRFDASYRDAFDKVRAGLIGRPFLVRSQTCDMNDPSGFFVRFSATSGGIFLDCSIHDVDLARWYLGNPTPRRVFAAGTIALHQGLREHGDADNGVAICEFADGSLACFQTSRTFAHGHETATEITGTEGRLSVGENPRLNRVEIADRHGVRNECTPTYWERFEEAFVEEASAFCRAVIDGTPPPLTLGDATEATRISVALMESFRSGRAVEMAPRG